MISIERTVTFKRDYKRLSKKHYDMNELKMVINYLVMGKRDLLITKYKDHSLSGNWQGYRELHIQKDWLLIYKFEKSVLVLTLTRTGSHDQVF